jgi:hypothetical protein
MQQLSWVMNHVYKLYILMHDTAHLLLAVYIPVSYSQQNLLKKHKILIESDIYVCDKKKFFFDVITK